MGRVGRRQFLIATGALFAAPLTQAQQPTKIWRIGFLIGGSGPPSFDASVWGGFLRGMRELAYVEGKDFIIEWRFRALRFTLC